MAFFIHSFSKIANFFGHKQIIEGSTIHTDGWKAYEGLIGYTYHRTYHHANEFSRGKSYVDGEISFWSFAKRRLFKFNGLIDEKIILYLKESEVRFNYSKTTSYFF